MTPATVPTPEPRSAPATAQFHTGPTTARGTVAGGPLELVPTLHGEGWGEPGNEESCAPGYCWCGRWGNDCEGLAAVRRGETPPTMDRVLWQRVEL